MIRNRHIQNLLFTLGLAISTGAYAQSPGYTKADLDRIWDNLADANNVAAYATAYLEGLKQGPAKLYPMTQSQGVSSSGSYRIISSRVAPKIQRIMNDRQIDLLEYQRKLNVFETQPSDKMDSNINQAIAERVQTLAEHSERKQAIALELYYINVLRSYQATTLVSKCRYLQEAEANRDQAGRFTADSSNPLSRIFADVEKANRPDVDAKLPCSLSASIGKVQPKTVLQQKINDKVADLLTSPEGKIQVTISKINEVTKGYEDILNDISINPMTKELLEIQKNFVNAKSNTELVSGDQLKVGDDIRDLAKIDVAKLDGLAVGSQNLQHPAIDKAYEKRLDLINSLGDFVSKIESVHTKAGTDQDSVSSCKGLKGSYDTIFATTSNADNKDGKGNFTVRTVKPVSVQTFKSQYTSCLAQTKAYIEKLSKQSEFDVFMEEFASKLDQLNDRVRYEKSKG